MARPRSGNIPQSAVTDPSNYPEWEPNAPPGHSGHPYPKMLTRKFTAEDREIWRQERAQIEGGRTFYMERCPRVGDTVPVRATLDLVDAGFADRVGEDLIAKCKEDEALILQMLGRAAAPQPPPTITITEKDVARNMANLGLADAPQPSSTVIADLERENERLRQLLATKQELERQLNEPIKTEKPDRMAKARAAKRAKKAKTTELSASSLADLTAG